MLTDRRFAFVGAGNMAEALIRGLIASGAVPAAHIIASGRRRERIERAAERLGIAAASDNAHCVAGADVVRSEHALT